MSCRKKLILAGLCAGALNGLLGTGGGTVLIPLLRLAGLDEKELFPASVTVILPLCLVTLLLSGESDVLSAPITWHFLLGSIPGGIAAGLLGQKIPVSWLHRILGILMLIGGIRLL